MLAAVFLSSDRMSPSVCPRTNLPPFGTPNFPFDPGGRKFSFAIHFLIRPRSSWTPSAAVSAVFPTNCQLRLIRSFNHLLSGDFPNSKSLRWQLPISILLTSSSTALPLTLCVASLSHLSSVISIAARSTRRRSFAALRRCFLAARSRVARSISFRAHRAPSFHSPPLQLPCRWQVEERAVAREEHSAVGVVMCCCVDNCWCEFYGLCPYVPGVDVVTCHDARGCVSF